MPANEPVAALNTYPPAQFADLLARTPFWLALPFTFATADAATLYTVPSGYRMCIHRAAWEIAVSMTGGATPAIGVSSDDANANTKGDILGGASGDLTATLVSTGVPIKGGTIGAKFASNALIVLAAGKKVRYDAIASAFTAGSGLVHIQVSFMPTS